MTLRSALGPLVPSSNDLVPVEARRPSLLLWAEFGHDVIEVARVKRYWRGSRRVSACRLRRLGDELRSQGGSRLRHGLCPLIPRCES